MILIPEIVPLTTIQASLTMKAGPIIYKCIMKKKKKKSRLVMEEGPWNLEDERLWASKEKARL